jgi:hypothetical protein
MDRNVKLLFAIGIILIIILGVIVFFALRGSGGGGLFSVGSTGGSGGGGKLPDSGGSTDGGNINDSGQDTISDIPDEERQRLVQLSKDPVIGPTINKSGDSILYFKRGVGNLFQTPFDGSGGEIRVSTSTIQNIIDARWSASKNYALLAILSNGTTKNTWVKIVATSTIKIAPFPTALTSYAFSPTEEKLASITRSGSLYSIMTSSPEGKNIKTVLTTQIPDYELYWIKKDFLAIKTKTSAHAPSLLQTMPAAGGIPTVTMSGALGFDVAWSPDGSTFIASSVSTRGYDMSLSLFDTATHDIKAEIGFATLPEKCVFSKKETESLFCAVPKYLGNNPLPDAWWQGRVGFNDELWRINTSTGETSLFLEAGGFDMTNLFLSPNENFIFFINKKDSTLWSYRIR